MCVNVLTIVYVLYTHLILILYHILCNLSSINGRFWHEYIIDMNFRICRIPVMPVLCALHELPCTLVRGVNTLTYRRCDVARCQRGCACGVGSERGWCAWMVVCVARVVSAVWVMRCKVASVARCVNTFTLALCERLRLLRVLRYAS